MTVIQYCKRVQKTINFRGVYFYQEHLMKIVRGKINYKLYIEEDMQNINTIIEVLAAMEY